MRIRNIATPPESTNGVTASDSPHRERILKAALALLTTEGRDALTTRAVAEAAGVQPPVLYRLFGNKEGLLAAVTEYGFALYLVEKRQWNAKQDLIGFIKEGWDRHIQFGLKHPELYLLMYANGKPTAAHQEAYPGLKALMHHIAAAGRLRLPPNQAADLFHAAACGVVMTLLAKEENDRDMSLSKAACEGALAAILTDTKPKANATTAAAANALSAHLSQPSKLFTKGERTLLLEWLERLTH